MDRQTSDGQADGPVFTGGLARSGTTLLHTALSLHSRIHSSREAHFLKEVRAAVVTSGDPGERFDLLWAAFSSSPQSRPTVDQGAVRANFLAAAGPGLREFVRAVLETDASARGKARWGAKVPDHIDAVPQVLGWFPDCRFIWITRDPRAVITSRTSASWNRSTDVSRLAGTWQKRADLRSRRWTADPRFLFIRYEDLVADWEGTIRSVLAHVGEEPEDRILHPAPTDLGFNTSFEGRDAPRDAAIVEGRNERWRNELSDRQVWSIQRKAARGMERFGYEPVSLPLLRRAAWNVSAAVSTKASSFRRRRRKA
jgi:hypothetical protein